jgi:putative membrane protein
MMTEAAANSQRIPTSNELAGQRTDLALERTRFAAERTLMAWLRTSLSMISFGFTIYKFLQEFARAEKLTISDRGPRNLGLALVGLGTVSLIVTSFQHWSLMKELQGQASTRTKISFVLIVAIIIALLGALVFFSMVLQTGPF